MLYLNATFSKKTNIEKGFPKFKKNIYFDNFSYLVLTPDAVCLKKLISVNFFVFTIPR